MREIKFKDYSKHKENGKISITEYTLEELWGEDSWQGVTNWEHLGTCQFTGLQDRAGKDIYEGDILTDDTELINPNRKRIFEVFWSKDSGWLVSDNWCLSGDSLSYYAERLEIIGNIHQNKELLK